MKAALICVLEKCAPLLCAARFLKGRDHCLASLLLGHRVSALLGEMDFIISDISKKLPIFTAQLSLLLLLPFKQQKLIHLPKEEDRWFAWMEETPAKPVLSSWLTEIMGRAELLPELWHQERCPEPGAELCSWS